MPNVLLCCPLDHISKAKRGILIIGHPRISIHFVQACTLERSLKCQCSELQKQHGRQQLWVISPDQLALVWVLQVVSNVWRDLHSPTGQLLPTSAGQTPVSNVVTSLSLPASLGAWRLGKTDKQTVNLAPGSQQTRWTKTSWCGFCSEKLSTFCCWCSIWWHGLHPLSSLFDLLRPSELSEHLHSHSMLTGWK